MDIVKHIDGLIRRYGGQRELARAIGVDETSLSHYRNGRREPSEEMADRLGLQRIVIYRRKPQ